MKNWKVDKVVIKKIQYINKVRESLRIHLHKKTRRKGFKKPIKQNEKRRNLNWRNTVRLKIPLHSLRELTYKNINSTRMRTFGSLRNYEKKMGKPLLNNMYNKFKNKNEVRSNLKQSPINFIENLSQIQNKNLKPKYATLDFIHRFYPTRTTCYVIGSGDSMGWHFGSGAGFIKLKNNLYNLIEINFSMPSEHTINGEHQDVEFQFLHKFHDHDFIIFSIMYNVNCGIKNKKDRRQKSFLDELIKILPNRIEIGPIKKQVINLQHMYDVAQGEFRQYSGSLTKYPHSENVQWFVKKRIHNISAEQYCNLAESISDERANNRMTQAINNRFVLPTKFY